VDSIVCHTQRGQFVADCPNVVVDAVDPNTGKGDTAMSLQMQ